MMRAEIDVPRLCRIVTTLLAVCAAVFVILQMEPAIDGASSRLTDDRDALRSAEVALASLPELERDRHLLAIRYARASGNAGAQFLGALSALARRHSVHVVLTSFKRDPTTPGVSADLDARFFQSDRLTVTLRGRYGQILRAIADLSTGRQIVRVDPPNLERDDSGDDVIATVPVAILEPIGGTT